ncbi:MAG: nucleotidyltransferase domain-containing protein [Gammaproteobacteria bacterium]
MNKANSPALLDELTDFLAKDNEIVVAIAFGSLISGRMRPDSDIDIAILTRSPMTPEQKEHLLQGLACLTGRAVDLVDLRTAGVVLMQSILRQGKRLICRDRRAYDHLVAKMLTDAADFLPGHQRLLEARAEAWLRAGHG